jgi:hypothetical protein
MVPGSLPSLAAAVAHEVSRLERDLAEHGLTIRIAVHINADAGTVVVEGDSLKMWGPRTMLEGRLKTAGLNNKTLMPSATIIVSLAS